MQNNIFLAVKIGTSSLIHPNGKINFAGIDQLAFVLTDLRNQGKEIILVSSGAIGVGMDKLGIPERPQEIPVQQAVAAVGQSELMHIYNQRFLVYSQQTAQVLLTRDVVDFPESRKNVIISMGIVPIINENDTVAVDEMDHTRKFGDNDELSAIVAQLMEADVLIMLSDIDGFYSDNPATNKQAILYSTISTINQTLMDQAGGEGSRFGTGGMVSKLKAAQRILEAKSAMVLANGKPPRIIFDILAGVDVGTLFKEEKHG